MRTAFRPFGCALALPFIRLFVAVLLSIGGLFPLDFASATISTTGDVSPAPLPGGGAVAGPFRVGNTTVGTMNIAGGTALTNTGAALVGDAAAGIGVVTMSGAGSDWTLTTASADLTVGNNGTGSIALSNFAKLATPHATFLASQANSQGEISVSGLGTVWNNAGNLTVGDRGIGALNIADGGRVTSTAADLGNNSSGDGHVSVSGTFSRWQVTGAINVGDAGRGTLLVEGGASVTSTLASNVGNQAGSVGDAEVSGAGSLWTNTGGMVVGSSGAGTVKILAGGRIASSSNVQVGAAVGSRGDVIVDGAGSVWNITGQISTQSGAAHITVSNGGLITTTVAPVIETKGQVSLAGGRFQTSAAGGITNRGLFSGSGIIDSPSFSNVVSDSVAGRLQTGVGELLAVTGSLNNSALVDLQGGELDVRGAPQGSNINTGAISAHDAIMRFGGSGLANNGSGQLAVTGGTVEVYGTVNNNVGAEIVVGGGSRAVFHDNLINSNNFFLMPGASALALKNLSFLPTSSLSLQLGAVDLTDGVGQLEVAGQATLAGNLSVFAAPGYTPHAGDSFRILTAPDGLTGDFASELLGGLPGGFAWRIDVNHIFKTVTATVIAAAPGLAADFDGDGDVDADDLALWKTGLGTTGGAFKSSGDANGDGNVDGADFAIWQQDLGNVAPTPAAAQAAPEPGTLVLALGVCIVGRQMRERAARRPKA